MGKGSNRVNLQSKSSKYGHLRDPEEPSVCGRRMAKVSLHAWEGQGNVLGPVSQLKEGKEGHAPTPSTVPA